MSISSIYIVYTCRFIYVALSVLHLKREFTVKEYKWSCWRNQGRPQNFHIKSSCMICWREPWWPFAMRSKWFAILLIWSENVPNNCFLWIAAVHFRESYWKKNYNFFFAIWIPSIVVWTKWLWKILLCKIENQIQVCVIVTLGMILNIDNDIKAVQFSFFILMNSV